MLLQENMDKYEGKELSHFENEYGKKLKDLHMVEDLVIVFSDGSKIKMSQDWRGAECYWSQYEIKD